MVERSAMMQGWRPLSPRFAQSGLLDGRRATTHWRWADDVARKFPAIELDQWSERSMGSAVGNLRNVALRHLAPLLIESGAFRRHLGAIDRDYDPDFLRGFSARAHSDWHNGYFIAVVRRSSLSKARAARGE